jgi:3-phosphoshikimate 1-carboxyvinyltransferase
MGANIEEIPNMQQLIVRGNSPLHGIDVDINDCIDAIVILAVIACYAEGQTVISNGAIARDKECDRIAALAKELKKMGADIEERPDGLIINGSRTSPLSPLQGAEVWSHRDHRMAMALLIAGMGANGATTVRDTACIAKTYPSFVQDFTAIGAMFK